MCVNSAVFSEFGDLIELWVGLAADWRVLDSHLRTEANRAPIREALARHVVVDGALVAREGNVGNGGTKVGSSAEDAGTDGLVGSVMPDTKAGAHEQDVTCGVVRDLFVRPAHRDAGVGTWLLAAAEDALADVDVSTAALDALAGNEAVRRFYRRHGYRSHRVKLERSMRGDIHSEEDG